MRGVSRSAATLSATALLCLPPVILVVNFLIYWAKALYYERNPDIVARKRPTISGALADPYVGEPFAAWMAVMSPLLFVGVACLVLAIWTEMKNAGRITGAPARRLTIMSAVLILAQGAACVGMVVLSQYRFPHFNDMHMAGSYLFFFSQAFVVTLGEIMTRSFLRHDPQSTVPVWWMARIRARFVWVAIFLGIAYLALFIGKGYVPRADRDLIMFFYTSTEPLLITSFLIYVALFLPDLAGVIRSYLRSGSRSI